MEDCKDTHAGGCLCGAVRYQVSGIWRRRLHWSDMLGYASNTGLGFIRPESPTLVPEPPTGEGWIHEIKYDGYRTLIAINRGQVRAFTRRE